MLRFGGIVIKLSKPLGVVETQRLISAIDLLRGVCEVRAIDWDCGDDKTAFERALSYAEELR